jgi:hypothetical protein
MENQTGSTPEQHPDDAAVAEVEAVLTGRLATLVKSQPRIKRAIRALYSLGLLPVVGKSWITLGEDDQIHFEPIGLDQFDKLVSVLEAIGDGVVTIAPHPGPGQLVFDFEPAPPSLPSPVGGVSLHAGVTR